MGRTGTVERFEELLPTGRADLGINKAKASFGKDSRYGGIVTDTLVLVHHPFLGKPLLDAYQTVSAYKYQTKEGVQDDFDMPRKAVDNPGGFAGEQREAMRRRTTHEQDPVIGKPFGRFFRDSLYIWERAMDIKKYDPAFEQAEKVAFIAPHTFFPSASANMLKEILNPSTPLYHRWGVESFAKEYKDGTPFVNSLAGNSEYWHEIRGVKIPLPISGNKIKERYDGGNPNRWKQLHDFVAGLDPAEAEKFIADQQTQYGAILAGLPNRLYLNRSKQQGVAASIRNGRSVGLIANDVKLIVEPARPIEPDSQVPGKIVDYEFPQEYWKAGIWALLAYSSNSFTGESRFMDRKEAYEAAKRIGLMLPQNAEPGLGIVVAGGYSEVVTEWEDKMELKDGKYAQRMQAAQAGVRPNTYQHAKDLFSRRNGVFQTLDQNIEQRLK